MVNNIAYNVISRVQRWDISTKISQIVDQRGLYDCKNAFVNSGYAIKKRSGIDKITASQLDAGSKGLFEFDEKLYVVEHTTNATQALSGYGAGGSYPINANLYTFPHESNK